MFSLWLVHCLLLGLVKEPGQVQSWTDGKNWMLLAVVRDLGLVFWHRSVGGKSFPWEPISTGAKHHYGQAEFKMA
jgi:hypothetical protein